MRFPELTDVLPTIAETIVTVFLITSPVMSDDIADMKTTPMPDMRTCQIEASRIRYVEDGFMRAKCVEIRR